MEMKEIIKYKFWTVPGLPHFGGGRWPASHFYVGSEAPSGVLKWTPNSLFWCVNFRLCCAHAGAVTAGKCNPPVCVSYCHENERVHGVRILAVPGVAHFRGGRWQASHKCVGSEEPSGPYKWTPKICLLLREYATPSCWCGRGSVRCPFTLSLLRSGSTLACCGLVAVLSFFQVFHFWLSINIVRTYYGCICTLLLFRL